MVRSRPALLLAAALLVGGCAQPSGATAPTPATSTSSPSASPSPSAPSVTAPTDIVAAGATVLTVPGGMDWIVAQGSSVWAASGDITRLDGTTGAVLSTTPTAGAVCLAGDSGFGSVWFGVCGTPQVMRIDPASGKVVATIGLEVSDLLEESSVAAGAGGIWVLSSTGDLVEVDPRTDKVARTAKAPAGASAIRATKDALWVTVHEADELVRLDPTTLAVTATVDVGDGPQFLAVGEGGIWTLDQEGGTVTRVDPRTAAVVATVVVDSGPVNGGDIAAGGGYVWARVTDALVAQIDPRTNTVVARYGPPAGSGGVSVGRGALWITAHDSDAIYRLPTT